MCGVPVKCPQCGNIDDLCFLDDDSKSSRFVKSYQVKCSRCGKEFTFYRSI